MKRWLLGVFNQKKELAEAERQYLPMEAAGQEAGSAGANGMAVGSGDGDGALAAEGMSGAAGEGTD